MLEPDPKNNLVQMAEAVVALVEMAEAEVVQEVALAVVQEVVES